MKRMSFLLPLIAIVIAFAGSAFTNRHLSKPVSNMSLYWYQVTYDQNGNAFIQSSADFVTQDEKANVLSPCENGAALDCLRGYTSQITSFPSSPSFADHIQKPLE